MNQTVVAHEFEEKRALERTHLFAAITVSWSGGSEQARLRNICAEGALIELPGGLRIGEKVRLRRGDVSASCMVVWSADKRIGIHFDRAAAVHHWLPAGSTDQRRVDETFRQFKQAPASPRPPSATPLPTSPRSAAEIDGIADMLDSLADSMAEDAYFVTRFMEKLQALDLASQQLRRMSRELKG